MDFVTNTQNISTPKNLYPCLATITLTSTSSKSKPRRSSFGSDKEDGNALTRVTSGGGRRKSSFGDGTLSGGRRLSFVSGRDDDKGEGRWYWRVQAGVNDTHLVLLPLTQPANPLLTTPPAPLSTAVPSHASHDASTHTDQYVVGEDGGDGSGFTNKVKNLFRRASTTTKEQEVSSVSKANHGSSSGGGERVIDQTARGEHLPSKEGNLVGATNVNASAEMGWPGTIHGEKLAGIVVHLSAIEKNKSELRGGKKNEGSWVNVQVNASTGQLESVGSNKFDPSLKAGFIKFEFDKDWLGAKAEAELLHHYISQAVSNAPGQNERATPISSAFRLGGAGGHKVPSGESSKAASGPSYGGPTSSSYPSEVGPRDQTSESRDGSSSGTGKIGEVY